MTVPVTHIPMGELLYRLQTTLNMNQKELAGLMGCSSRTIIRYYQRGGLLLPSTYAKLAKACQPHDPTLAAYLAAHAGMSIEQLAGGKPVLLPEPAPAPSPAAAPLLPAPGALPASRPAPSSRLMADSVVCAGAEAMQCTPQAMRPSLMAALERVVALGMSAEEALEAMRPAPEKPEKAAKGGKPAR
jgi:hypothetical protein